jgi:uncharacterized protein YciI
MFVILLTYIHGIDPILTHLDAHRKFLDKYYEAGKFICSGAQKPRNGGVIICCAPNKAEVEEIIKEDPFNINEAASYQIIEFEASKFAPVFANFV